MTAPRVSAIIVSYNRPALLRRAIDSALAQTLTDREVIVIDNCSKFDIFELLAPYGSAIRVMRNIGNLGCGHARNTAVREAAGEFVAFLDDDDHWRPEKLQRQLETIGDCVMSVCGQELIPVQRTHVKPITRVTQAMLRFGNDICGPSGFVCRRDLFDRISFDESLQYAEDWDFLIAASHVGEIAYVPEALLCYTVDASGASMTSQPRWMDWGDIQYRFRGTDKHRAFLGEFFYRRRLAKIALSHIAARRNKLAFVGHSIRKAGVVATGLALGEALGGKLGGAMRSFVRSARSLHPSDKPIVRRDPTGL